MKGMRRRGVLVLVGIAVLGALATAGYVVSANRTPATKFRTATLDRGTVVATVSATGALNAVTTVQVGSQVSGQVKEVLVDFNTPVRSGQLVARIETDVFQAKVNAATADLESAQAQVLNQRANVEKVRADVENARAAAVDVRGQRRADAGRRRERAGGHRDRTGQHCPGRRDREQREARARPAHRPRATGAHLEERARSGPDGVRHHAGAARGDARAGARRSGGAAVVPGPADRGRIAGPRGQGPGRVGPGGPAGGRGAAQGGRGHGPTEAGRPRADAARPGPHRDPGAGGRRGRLADRRSRADRRGEPPGADALHDRPGPHAHAGRGGGRRGRRRTPPRGHDRDLHGRRVPGAHVPRRDLPDPQGRPGRAERRELHHGDHGPQPRPLPAPRDDCQRARAGRPARGRAPRAQCRSPLSPARGQRRARRPASSARGLRRFERPGGDRRGRLRRPAAPGGVVRVAPAAALVGAAGSARCARRSSGISR